MSSIERAIINSIEDPGSTNFSREAEIRCATNPVKRTGLLAIHKVATRHPAITSAAFGLGYDPKAQRMGGGYASNVYMMDENTVLKIDKQSMGMSRRQLQEKAGVMRYEHEAFVSYLGESVLSHDIAIGPHPNFRNVDVIRIMQPFVQVDFLNLKASRQGIPSLVTTIKDTTRIYQNTPTELQSIVDGSRALFSEHRLSTDLEGNDNIGISNGRLTIVDAQPVTLEYPKVQVLINTYLDNLEDALALAA
jgi:hypothetical protein